MTQDTLRGGREAKQWNSRIAGLYEEFSISKEEPVQNLMTVTVRKSNDTEKKLVQLDTDIPGEVTVHWGVCKDDSKKWEIPPTPHPPATKLFRSKALQTSLQVCREETYKKSGAWYLFLIKSNGNGFSVDLHMKLI